MADSFQEIPRDVLRAPGLDRPLAVVLDHLRFAKQRFDSSADPMAKVAFMLLPIATLLAYIGSDNRHKKEDRERATRLLKKLDSKFALALGVSAGWGIVCQAFLRLFDKQNHDVAKTHGEIRALKLTLEVLFLKGGIFHSSGLIANIESQPLPAIGGYVGKDGWSPCFVTRWMEKTLKKKCVVNCGGD